MKAILKVIRKHSILIYIILTFVISWGGVLLLIGSKIIQATTEQTTKLFPYVLLITIMGPGLASILLTSLNEGREGLREIVTRLLKWRVGLYWYASALLIAPLTVVTSLIVLSQFSHEFLPGFLSTQNKETMEGLFTTNLLFLLFVALLTGFLEELGWTGFAIPRLRLRYGLFTTGIIVGFLWGAWHLVSNLWGSSASAGMLPIALYMAALLFTFLPPYRILMVWVYDNTKSLFVAILMHASLVIFWLISTPVGISGKSQAIWYLTWAAVLCIVVALVFTFKRRRNHFIW